MVDIRKVFIMERDRTPWLRDMKFSQDRWCKRRKSQHEKILIDVQRILKEIPRRIKNLQILSMVTYRSISQYVFLVWDHVFSDDTLKCQKHVVSITSFFFFPKYVWRVSVCFSNQNCVIINRRYLGMNTSNWSPDLIFICYFRNFRYVATALSFIQLQRWKGVSARDLTETLVRNMYDVKSKISWYEYFDLCWKHWINTKWLKKKSKLSLFW